MRGIFVTGTDTGIGKTAVTSGLVNAFSAQGTRVVGLKPVVSGAVLTAEGPLWEDVVALENAGGEPLSVIERAPYRFHPPCAPDLAAHQAGVTIDLATLQATVSSLEARADMAVVEGVGGFRVPLTRDLAVSDWIEATRFPVLLVVGIRLGCINHALLTAEAIQARGLPFLGWVANHLDPTFAFADEAIESIAARWGAPIVSLPWFSGQPQPQEWGGLVGPFFSQWVVKYRT